LTDRTERSVRSSFCPRSERSDPDALNTFLQVTISGLATGAIYALAAVGFALLWQTAGAINFAHGEFVAMPAVGMLVVRERTGLGVWPSIGIGLLLGIAILGVTFKFGLVDRLLKQDDETPLVVATIGLGLLFRELARVWWSATAKPFNSVFGEKTWKLDSRLNISANDIGVILTAIIVILALQLFLSRTFTGRQMDAVAQNRDTAKVLGIPVGRMILLTFVINAVLVTIASVLDTPFRFAKFDNGLLIGTFAFASAIVGGFNQVRGALAGGFLIGLLYNYSGLYLSKIHPNLAQYRDAVPLLLLILVIVFRPQGLFGRAEQRRI
jgi:branched-chain amino acid transport system permease protein